VVIRFIRKATEFGEVARAVEISIKTVVEEAYLVKCSKVSGPLILS